MSIFGGKPPGSCPSSRQCAEWARIYLKYCLCSQKDGAALTLGLLSVISWGIAEVPQIMTNYIKKSTEGLSIAFLMTWIVGDLFNLVGCFLEPATLPTQFYMALLYTITTVVLTGQTINYRHIYHRLKAKKSQPHKHQCGDASLREKLLGSKEKLLGSKDDGASRNSILSVVPWMSLLLAMCVLNFFVGSTHVKVPSGTVIPVGRKILLFKDDLGHSSLNHDSGSGIGSILGWAILGWAMAIIYIGGRLPQIFLNMKRGHADKFNNHPHIYSPINCDGLSPLMFTFALVGNITYVASILVNSMDWSTLRPNLPWLVDAGGCASLDLFIILQFLYFQYRKQSEPADEHDNADKV